MANFLDDMKDKMMREMVKQKAGDFVDQVMGGDEDQKKDSGGLDVVKGLASGLVGGGGDRGGASIGVEVLKDVVKDALDGDEDGGGGSGLDVVKNIFSGGQKKEGGIGDFLGL